MGRGRRGLNGVVAEVTSSRPLDPHLEAGPRSPTDVLRPLESEQRILCLDGPEPMMVDLAQGNIRRWENGPPLSIPCVSTPFDLVDYETVLVQVQRDPRPTSVDLVLLSLDVDGQVVDVIERVDATLEIRSAELSAVHPIGASLAVVITIHPTNEGLTVRARNAESLNGAELSLSWAMGPSRLTIGGPSVHVSGRYGRRRLIPAFVDVQRRRPPVDQVQRARNIAERAARGVGREIKGRFNR